MEMLEYCALIFLNYLAAFSPVRERYHVLSIRRLSLRTHMSDRSCLDNFNTLDLWDSINSVWCTIYCMHEAYIHGDVGTIASHESFTITCK